MPFEFTGLHRISDDRVVVVTMPPKMDAVYAYPFHRIEGVDGDVWVLGKSRKEYTDHALQYAREKMSGTLVPRCVAPTQSGLAAHDASRLPSATADG